MPHSRGGKAKPVKVQRCHDKHEPGLDRDSASDIRSFLTLALTASAEMPCLTVVIAWRQAPIKPMHHTAEDRLLRGNSTNGKSPHAIS